MNLIKNIIIYNFYVSVLWEYVMQANPFSDSKPSIQP